MVIILLLSLSFSALWGPGSSPAIAQGGGLDLALVINGSGSISPGDFALQKEGIKAALRNPLIFPRNGSIAVTIVQYADRTTQVHVPLTVINNAADAASVIAQVDNITQIGGLTNPGDGINTAMDVFNASGNPANEQAICLSTDGLPNAGADVATALNNAKASPIGLEKFSVIAIEDPPAFFEPDFQTFYGPLVFGGGAVTVVRNTVEYASVMGATCLAPEVELIALEVNQAIQDWLDGVQVIEDKTTYVRAHIQTKGPDPVVAVVRLRGFRNGAELPGSPLTAINPGGSIIAGPDAVARRANLLDSLNFRLPQSWLSGTVDLRVEGVGGRLDCEEFADTPGDCSVQVTFNPTDNLEVKFLRVRWTDAGGTAHNPSGADIFELSRRLLAIFPIDFLDWATGQLTWTGAAPPSLDSLNTRLATIRNADGCTDASGCQRLYYGVLVGAPFLGGLANGIPGTVASGDIGAEPNVHAHELAHLLGRRHATFCGAQDPAAPPFPYTAEIGGQTVATIGPLNLGEERRIFGFDTRPIEVLSPLENFELMSYCVPLWISDFTYNPIRTAINGRFPSTPPPSPPPPVDPCFLFRGTVDFKNDTAEFLPLVVVFILVCAAELPPGDHTLELRDTSGNLIRSISFRPTEQHAFGTPDPGTGLFIIPVRADPAIKQAVILRNGSVLTSRTASASQPSVQVLFPNGGESLSADEAILEWAGGDPDGDEITYTVQYSADGGSTWETLIVD